MKRLAAEHAVLWLTLSILALPALAAAEDATHVEGRVVSGAGDGEAGVWVIAETSELPTPYRKIVVTDDAGRFVVPDLPESTFQMWVRGYGLRDSGKTPVKRGSSVTLKVEKASSPREAARIFPANYWFSLFEPPGKSAAFASQMKLGCELCHQLGSATTRGRARAGYDLGLRKASFMNAFADHLGREQLLDALEAWSLRIQNGETPEPPPRPRGLERNVVITQWAWGDGYTYAHDEIATDKRDPTVNAGGPVYGVDIGNDHLLVLDPDTHRVRSIPVPTEGAFATPWCDQTYKPLAGGEPLPYGFGSLGCPVQEGITGFTGKYQNPANPHNPMMDAEGRVWLTTQVRREWGEDLPSFCRKAPVIADNYHHRQLGYWDPKTESYELIDTCYGTHHLQFDEKGVLWTSGDSYVVGWFDPAKYDPARPESLGEAQGWSEVVVDSDGDGEPDRPIVGFHYGVIPNPTDGSVWTAHPGAEFGAPLEFPGLLMRYDPATDRHEVYRPPAPGSGPRGVDVDRAGNIWASLGGSGHLARFDRSRCKKTWGIGDQCPEGWTLWRSPGPGLRGLPAEAGSADMHYYIWVDQWNTLGMGHDKVVMNGTGSDSILVFDPETEEFTVIRVPYPLNTYTRGLDGRIDDAKTGWKGRGLWFNNGLDPLIHSEIQQSYVGWIQLRPDPLAK